MSRGPDAGVLLERRLVAAATAAGCTVSVGDADWRRWASATFAGARHRITLVAADQPALEDWLGGLAEADLPLGRDHLLADLCVVRVARSAGWAEVDLEALTVEQ